MNLFLYLRILFITVFISLSTCLWADGFVMGGKHTLSLYVGKGESEVVHTAADLLRADYQNVFGAELISAKLSQASIVAGTVSESSVARLAKRHGIDVKTLSAQHEGFVVKVLPTQPARLLVLGSDKRGTAYGLMQVSRLMGVSPWEWWADCVPARLDSLVLPSDYMVAESPSVPFRGIFLNDEDWGLMPWASTNYELQQRTLAGGDSTVHKGEIGPYTHARIFELLLRLRANLFWPAMHECSVPFYLVPGNQAMADKYGIIVSTSHCEPMMCNANGEWRKWANDPKGHRYNYLTNRDQLLEFWQERVDYLKNSDCVYTLGLRGIHDGRMNGAKTIPEQVEALRGVLKDQRDILRTVNRDVTRIPQQFVPYKEVLDCYHAGLEVPEDVTLIWCDDNYGYIRHLPTAEERKRSGGHGIYYHISYWGRPHDYLWLATTHPQLIRSEMLRAYDNGIQKMWVLNVGDIKPGEYLTNLFLDMAWDIESFRSSESLQTHISSWYEDIFGIDGSRFLSLWEPYYALSFAHRPEFMAGTRTEEKNRYTTVADLPLNERQIRERLAACKQLDLQTSLLSHEVPAHLRSAWFQLVEYPLRAMVAQNEKALGAQLARHRLGEWWEPKSAYDRIQHLTQTYNSINDGKWRGMMSAAPRKLEAYAPVREVYFDTPMPQGSDAFGKLVFQSDEIVGQTIPQGNNLVVESEFQSDSVWVEIHLLPIHPINDRTQRISVSVDGSVPQMIDYRTVGRSETWKQNVLYNAARMRLKLPVTASGSSHRIVIEAVDEGVRVQRVYLSAQ